jgi:hypothetical protein
MMDMYRPARRGGGRAGAGAGGREPPYTLDGHGKRFWRLFFFLQASSRRFVSSFRTFSRAVTAP